MDQTLEFRSSDAKLNRLIENAKRGQRSNFIDVPTDCPQRDERLGWTADTQVFAATASYNAETYSFYKKFMRDMAYDQNVYYDGEFPMYSPSLKGVCGPGGAVWSDAGVIVPWMLYRFYGDKELLRIHYEGIKKYLRKLCRGDEERRDGHLLSAPFTFGDWLAQDGICAQSMRGGTDDTFIRSVYYYNTACTAAEAADPEEKSFRELAKDIRKSILDEYFSKSGRLAVDTQTAYVLSLHFGIYVDKDKVKEGFRDRLRKDLYRMKSGEKVLHAENYYEDGCPTIDIPLDPLLSPQQNAAKNYKQYNKLKTAEFHLRDQIEKAENERAYLESVLQELSQAETEQEFNEIRRELQETNYIRKSSGKKELKRAFAPRTFKTSSGLEVLVGRSNVQNDQLTKKADKRDYWFHTQHIHGSHVILRCAGLTPSDDDLREAAMLASYFSQAKESSSVPVDYCPVKFVKKPAGARPGMVTYDNYRTLYVTPEEGLVKKLFLR